MSDDGDEKAAIKWLMKRLLKTTAESFDIALARYETSEREAALAEARRLMDSDDPAEKLLGERLRAEVLKEQPLVIDGRGLAGAEDPLSSSPRLSLPAAATPSAGAEEPPKNRGSGRPPKPESSTEAPVKRPPGRPRKEVLSSEPPEKRKVGRPRKEQVSAEPPEKRGAGKPHTT